MAHLPSERLLSFLGIVLWGDFGPTTLYRNKNGKLVAFQKTFPKKAPSAAQLLQRQLFIDAATAWQQLTTTQQAQWELATKRTSLRMTGYDLFVHNHITGDDDAIRAVARQSATTLLPP